MKLKLLFVISCVLVFGISCTNRTNTSSNPESLIRNFVTLIENGKIDDAFNLSPFINDNLVKKIDPKESAFYYDALLPQDNLITPFDTIRKYSLLSLYGLQIRGFISSIVLPEEFYDYYNYYGPVSINGDENKVDIFLSALNIQNLKSLELIRHDVITPNFQFSERGRRSIETQKKIYGFDERVEYSTLYKHNGKYYSGTMTIVKYGKNWYILTLNSILGNTSMAGTLKPVSGVIDYLNEFDIKE